MLEDKAPLLAVRGLKHYFRLGKNYTVKAVENISFDIMPGETFGLVGESGSGKTTVGQAVIRLYNPTAGRIVFNGEDISGKLTKAQNTMLRTNMQMVFQDPMASLNPYKKIIDTIAMGLDAQFPHMNPKEREQRVYSIMEKVGLSKSQANRYPSQLSGGQRQRIGLARALIMNPKLIIADEAISALDVSIQAQVVNLMKDLQLVSGMAYLFIAHDLSMVRYISDVIGVMHMGYMVESGLTDEIFSKPVHPYTKSLLSAIPRMNPYKERTRRPMEYDPESFRVRYADGTNHFLSRTHSVLSTDAELAEWEDSSAQV
ncbi:MAG: ABC transporter ATP-binding protein [Bacillota bacterium]|nr:ABC transporter ATP-binding protein [Bacillota bacterium]